MGKKTRRTRGEQGDSTSGRRARSRRAQPDHSRPAASGAAEPFPVVGIGASAGGLDALRHFFSALAADAGLAYVVVQHADPSRPSLLAELLARHTSMPVIPAEEGIRLAPNHVYVAPQNLRLEVRKGAFHLAKVKEAGQRRFPIDGFFRSLAKEFGRHAIGIVLSGAGRDGALGLKLISEARGLAIAQDEGTARFGSMPRQAIATGVVDHVVPPRLMPRLLAAHAQHLRKVAEAGGSERLQQQIADRLSEIASILRETANHDFRQYKTSTMVRRVQRRMQVLRLRTVARYLARLKSDSQEAQALVRELLINVTAFFRDQGAFESLATHVLPAILRGRKAEEQVRIWVPGCATGEEAYTFAMLAREALTGEKSPPAVQIFATDIDEEAIQVAREGAYPLSIAEQVSPERLARFFVQRGKRYHVTAELRDMCLFSVHNLIADPPFSRLDLISCRNVLIYLGQQLQTKLIPLFHFALRPGGYLLLGPSESISSHGDLFRTVDAKHRILQRKAAARRLDLAVTLPREFAPLRAAPVEGREIDFGQLIQRLVLDEFCPKYAVVNEQMRVVYLAAEIGKYLQPAEGAYDNNIVRMARKGLRVGLRAALTEAIRKRKLVEHRTVSMRTAEGAQQVAITVRPLPGIGEDSDLFLVIFRDRPGLQRGEDAAASPDSEGIIDQLERELLGTRDDLESTVQELEAANEELKSSNEELLSMNEELQSANEELETSKEEVQSGLDALARAHSDLENLLTSSGIATVFLDGEGRIKSFTPAVTAVYNLLSGDAGRPLSHITHRASRMPGLPSLAEVVAAGGLIEQAFGTEDRRFWIRRAQPYREVDGAVTGLVLTYTDITDLARTQAERAQLAAIVETSEDAIIGMSPEGVITSWNSGAERMYGYTAADAVGQPVTMLIPEDRRDEERAILARLHHGERIDHYETIRRTRDGRLIDISLTVSPIKDEGGGIIGASKVARDITRRRRTEQALRESELRKGSIVEASLDCIVTMDDAGRIVDFNGAAERTFGRRAAEVVGRPLADVLIPPRLRDAHWAGLQRYLRTGEAAVIGRRLVMPALRVDGQEFLVELSISVVRLEGQPPFFAASLRDITERTRAEEALRESEGRLRAVIDTAVDGIITIDQKGIVQTVNPAVTDIFGYTPDEVVGRNVSMLMPEPYHSEHDGYVGNYLRSGIKRIIGIGREVTGLRKDGSTFPMDLAVSETHVGDRIIFTGIVRDITDRKLAEQALRESEERFRLATEAGKVGVWDWDIAGDVVTWSESLYEIHGVTRATFAGNVESFSNLVHPDDREMVTRAITRTLELGTEYDLEFRALRPDGKVRWIYTNARVVRDDAGRALRMLGGSVDITDRKRAELAIAESEERFRTVANASPVLIWLADAAQQCTWFNQGWLEFTGRAMEQELGEGWMQGIHPGDRERCVQTYRAAFERRESFELEYRLRHARGEYRWVLDRGAPLHQPDGTFVGFIGGCLDIQERRAVEEANRLLAEAGAALAGSLDYEETLARVANILVPTLADWCAIDLRNEQGTIDLAAVSTSDPGQREVIRDLRRKYPTSVDDATGLGRVIRTRRAEVFPEVGDDMLQRAAHDEQHLERLRALHFRSAIIAPLVVRGEAIGGITLVTSRLERRFGEEDRPLIEEIARRAAQAIDNARLFEEMRGLSKFNEQILESSGDFIAVLDLAGRLIWMNSAGRALMEVDRPEELISRPWLDLWREGDSSDTVAEAIERGRRGDPARVTGSCPTMRGRPRWWDVFITPIMNEEGVPERLLAVSRDVTERIRWEEHQKMLLAELSHRVKNTLATVQSVAMQTLRTSRSMDEFADRFQSRLQALSGVHGLLMRHQWRGASVRDLVELVLQPYVEDHDHSGSRDGEAGRDGSAMPRFRIEGPAMTLRPQKALALHLCLHELATNAVKHGALSEATGELSVRWEVMAIEPARASGGPGFGRLIWTESAPMPRRTAPNPTSEGGFGMGLIRRVASYELRGEATIDLRPEGLRCELTFELERDELAAEVTA